MTRRKASPGASARRARGPGGLSTGALRIRVAFCVQSIAPAWLGASTADTKVAMSGRAPQEPIVLGPPQLSPDGKLAALHVHFDEFLPLLIVFDIDREELVNAVSDSSPYAVNARESEPTWR